MAAGDYVSAAGQARNALKDSPQEAMLHILAGSLLLNTGDFSGAKTAFTTATQCDPKDGLALYGLGLAQLATGNRTAALDSFARSERNAGDPAYLLIARRYTQWLGGAQLAVNGAGVPEAMLPAQYALEGMEAWQQGNRSAVTTALGAAQKALPGDPTAQPGGLLMRFDTTQPIDTAAQRLPGSTGLNSPLPAARGLSGDVALQPDQVTPSTAFVTYELDGQTLSLVNTPPYECVVDTRRFTNGWHNLTILLLDSNSTEITRVTRRILLANRGGRGLASGKAGEERVENVRAALWESLMLSPDRSVCAYMEGLARRALGDLPGARKCFLRVAAIRPDYRDTRQQFMACGGEALGGEAVWGGLPTEKVVALTFDDGPKPGGTEPLLDILVREHVPATFFVIGRHVTEYPELTRKITDAGMEIANHSYTHPNLTRLSEEEIACELLQTQAAIQMATGKTPRLVRPPGGNWNSKVAGVAKRWGLTACMWTVDVYGSEVISAQQVADAALAQVQPGSILLMHNGKMSTLQALPTIIHELRRRGYSFATVETLTRRLNAAKAADRESARLNAQATARRAE